jgi:hypothetical protein
MPGFNCFRSPVRRNWLCFFELSRSVYYRNFLSHNTLCLFAHWQIGFVFSNRFSKYATPRTLYKINWLCFFEPKPPHFSIFPFHIRAYIYFAFLKLALFFQLVSKPRINTNKHLIFFSLFVIPAQAGIHTQYASRSHRDSLRNTPYKKIGFVFSTAITADKHRWTQENKSTIYATGIGNRKSKIT